MLWAVDQQVEQPLAPGMREHILPTGEMHLVFRLSGQPLCLFEGAADLRGHRIGQAVVGGARSTFYIKDITRPSCSVGAMLRPGAAELLFDATADDLAQRHTRLDELWGRAAHLAHEQLLEAGRLEQQLAILETLLASRLPVVRGLHPAIAYALEHFETSGSVHAVVQHSGYSHRHFIDLFQRAVGLTPKVYGRVRRFQKALQHAALDGTPSWAALALEVGYSDQAHFNRDFLKFAGVTPTAYRQIAPTSPSHVVLSSLGRICS